jgi:hypothetical protein
MKTKKSNNHYIDTLQNNLIFEENLNKELTKKISNIQEEYNKLKEYINEVEKNKLVLLNCSQTDEDEILVSNMKSELENLSLLNKKYIDELNNLNLQICENQNIIDYMKNENKELHQIIHESKLNDSETIKHSMKIKIENNVLKNEVINLNVENDKLKKIILQMNHHNDCCICDIL